MDFSMVGNAEGFAIINIKAQSVVVGPGDNVMCMNGSGLATLNTGITVTREDLFPPLFQFGAKAGSLSIKRPAVFPCTGIGSCSTFTCTGLRAKILMVFNPGHKTFTTERAVFGYGWGTMAPTSLRAILCIYSVRRCFKTLSANLASAGNALLSVLTADGIKTGLRAIFVGPGEWMKFYSADHADGYVVSPW
jgi:hypothetical protein